MSDQADESDRTYEKWRAKRDAIREFLTEAALPDRDADLFSVYLAEFWETASAAVRDVDLLTGGVDSTLPERRDTFRRALIDLGIHLRSLDTDLPLYLGAAHRVGRRLAPSAYRTRREDIDFVRDLLSWWADADTRSEAAENIVDLRSGARQLAMLLETPFLAGRNPTTKRGLRQLAKQVAAVEQAAARLSHLLANDSDHRPSGS